MKTQGANTTSDKILAIRSKAGNHNTTCPTCGKHPSNPFRIFTEHGEIKYGCIDAIHTGRLVQPSESSRWHAQGQKLRRDELVKLKSL